MKFTYYKLFGLALIVITILILTKVASAGEKSEWLNDNPCMIKVVITNTVVDDVTTTTKQEKLECKDGYDGPNYWELFAQFYYSGITNPAYCRPYARPDHPFKTPGMICLSEDGVWEKQQMTKLLLIVACIVVITVHWSDFNDKVNVTKMVEKTIEIVKEGSK